MKRPSREELAEYKARIQIVIDAYPHSLDGPEEVAENDQLFAGMMAELNEAGAPITEDFLLGILTVTQAWMATLIYAGDMDEAAKPTLTALIGTCALTQKYVIQRLEVMYEAR